MIRNLRKICCLLLAVLLIPAAALAGQIDNLLDMMVGNPEGKTLSVEASCTVSAIPQFSEQRIAWLNGLLKHLTFRITTGEAIQEAAVLVDGLPSIGFFTREGEQGEEYLFSFDPDTAYRTGEDLDLISGLSGTESDISAFTYYTGIHQLLSGYYDYFAALPEAFPDACTWTKISAQYKGYGTAVSRCAISLPEEVFSSQEMADFISSLDPGPARDMLSGMVYSGRQRYTLLLDENKRPMKINYTGRAGLSTDSMRSVNVDWRCLRGESGYKDVLKFTNPTLSGNARNNITMTREMIIGEDGAESMAASVETDHLEDRVRTRTVCKIQLDSRDDQITGIITERTVIGGSADLKTIQITMDGSGADEYKGTLEITQEMNKIEKNHFLIQFTLSPGEEIIWNAMETLPMKPEDLPILAQKITRSFLRSLLPLPEEDLQFFLADLPDGWWDQFRSEHP